MSSFNCIDVSEWNGNINWDEAKADGVEFAFIRCGFGQDSTGQDDKYFTINMDNALEAGVKVGVYFYSYATNYDTACSEAIHCLRLIEPYRDKISFPIFYDIEEERNKPRIKDIVDGFRNTLEYYGYNVGVYTMISWYDAYFKDIVCDYIWLAFWGSDDGEPHTKPNYCDVWQYTSKGTVNGVGASCVDCDILYNEDMKLLINTPEPKPESEPVPLDSTVNIDILVDAPENIKVNVNIHHVKKD